MREPQIIPIRYLAKCDMHDVTVKATRKIQFSNTVGLHVCEGCLHELSIWFKNNGKKSEPKKGSVEDTPSKMNESKPKKDVPVDTSPASLEDLLGD